MEALCVPIPPEAEESTPTDITSNEQEDQILLEVGGCAWRDTTCVHV